MSSLFREEVLHAQSGERLGAISLAVPMAFRWWALLATALAAGIILTLIFGHYTHRETVSGQLFPTAGLLTLPAHTTGIVSRTFVREGEQVQAGQPLVEFSADLVSATMGNTHAIIAAQLRAQEAQVRTTLSNLKPHADEQSRDLRARIGMLKAQMSQIGDQLSLQREQATNATNFVEKIKPTLHSGIISVAQFNTYQSAALNDQSQLKALERQRLDIGQQFSSLEAQLAQLPLDTAAKANQLRVQLGQLDMQLAQNEAEGGTVLKAPCAGMVSVLLVNAGQSVTSGEAVLSILPRGSKLEAQLLVPSNAIGFVRTGTSVVLRYRAYPYQRFGQQFGKVVQVSHSTLSPAETATLGGQGAATPMYRVLVSLDRQTINAFGTVEPLKPGMALTADLLVDRRNLWQWVFEPIRGIKLQLAGNEASHQ